MRHLNPFPQIALRLVPGDSTICCASILAKASVGIISLPWTAVTSWIFFILLLFPTYTTASPFYIKAFYSHTLTAKYIGRHTALPPYLPIWITLGRFPALQPQSLAFPFPLPNHSQRKIIIRNMMTYVRYASFGCETQ